MINSRPFQPVSQVMTGPVPVQFSYSQVSSNNPTTYLNLHPNINPQQNFIPIPTTNVFYEPPSKTNSQIIYRTQTLPNKPSSVSFHHLPNNQPIYPNLPNNQSIYPNNPQNIPFQPSYVPLTSVRPHFMNRNISDFRRDVSPMDTPRIRNSQYSNINKDP